MLLVIGALLVIALIFGPSLWVKFVMRRYSSEKPEMPGTGGELAQHLIERFSLNDVKVEVTELGDHYDPIEKKVRLSKENYESKSLTAIAIAAHEVGHAIQDQQGDRRLAIRTKMVPIIDKVARLSAVIISLSPVIGIITRHPMPFSLLLLLGLSGFIARMMVHAVTLPIEFDASPCQLNLMPAFYLCVGRADILNLRRYLY